MKTDFKLLDAHGNDITRDVSAVDVVNDDRFTIIYKGEKLVMKQRLHQPIHRKTPLYHLSISCKGITKHWCIQS